MAPYDSITEATFADALELLSYEATALAANLRKCPDVFMVDRAVFETDFLGFWAEMEAPEVAVFGA